MTLMSRESKIPGSILYLKYMFYHLLLTRV